MRVPGRMVLAVVSGGIALGAMLGSAANPEMKQPPDQLRQAALQAPVYADPGFRFVEAGPEDLSPYRDSYAPSWANEELANWEPDYPAWSYSDFSSDLAVEQAAPSASEQPPAVDSAAPALPEESAQPPEPEALTPEPHVAGPLAALY